MTPALQQTVFELLIAALVVWRVSTTLAVAKIFEPLRHLFAGDKRGLRAWIHELITCQFCISHYIALLYLRFWYIDVVRTKSPLANFAITWIAVVALSSIIARLYQKREAAPPAAVQPLEEEREVLLRATQRRGLRLHEPPRR